MQRLSVSSAVRVAAMSRQHELARITALARAARLLVDAYVVEGLGTEDETREAPLVIVALLTLLLEELAALKK